MLFFLSLISCSSTKIETIKSQECNSEVKITKYKEGVFTAKGEGKRVEKGNHFYVYFTEGYENDKIKAFINGKLLFDKTITTDESLGTTEKGFYYKYGEDKNPVVLKVIKNGNENCFDIILDKKFRQLFVYSDDSQWDVIYDNIYPLYE